MRPQLGTHICNQATRITEKVKTGVGKAKNGGAHGIIESKPVMR
jgi:hypothetical protein